MDEKHQYPKVLPDTPIASIKACITGMAQETIAHVNVLSGLAFGEARGTGNAVAKVEVETLTSLLLDSMRQNSKLYGNLLFILRDSSDQGIERFTREINRT